MGDPGRSITIRGGWSGAEVVTRCKLDPITLTQARSGSLGTLRISRHVKCDGGDGGGRPGGGYRPPRTPPLSRGVRLPWGLGKCELGLGKCELGLGKCDGGPAQKKESLQKKNH